MEINDSIETIRQQQPGQFRKPEDGKKPYAHVNSKSLDSTEDQKEASIYVRNEKIAPLEKDENSDFPKLFDSDAGMKFRTTDHSDVKNEEEESLQQYDRGGKEQTFKEKVNVVDQWV